MRSKLRHNSEKWPTYADYLASPEWAKLRGMAIDRAKGRCQLCNSNIKLQVHHRVYDCKWGEESTDDLTCLCEVVPPGLSQPPTANR